MKTDLLNLSWMFTLILMLDASLPLPGQEPQEVGSISGIVTNASVGLPLQGANVQIEGTFFGAATGNEGAFEMANIPPGTYGLRVSYIGFLDQVATCTVRAGRVTTVNFSLIEETIQTNQIEVTARKRSESLQDVPTVVSVYSSREIQDAGIERPADFIQLTSNVSLSESQNIGTSFMTIRGLTQVRNGESPVAVVIDGVLMVNSNQFTGDLFDVEQVEVLKGPQGALYGRNAIGGAINIITKQPTDAFEGFVRVGAGNGGRGKAQAVVSGPIVKDKLHFSAAGSYLSYDGYIDNIFRNEKADPFLDRTGRLKLRWTPSDNVTIDVRGSLSRSAGGAQNFVVNSQLYIGGPDFVGDPDDTSVPIMANVRSKNDRTIGNVSLRADFQTGLGTLTSVSSFDKVEEFFAGDRAPYLSTSDLTVGQYLDVDAFSQELRLTSPGDRRFRWLVGGYFLRMDRFFSTFDGMDQGQGVIARVEREPVTGADNPTVGFIADDNHNSAAALFAQFNFDLTAGLELSGALRYDRDERKQTDRVRQSRRDVFGNPLELIGLSENFGVSRTESFDRVQPKVTLSFKPTADINLFALYSEGFRSGGFNAAGISESATQAGLVGVKDVFDKETSKNFEAGFKTVWLENHLGLNGGLFKTDVSGQHYFSFIGPLSAQVLTNIDKVDLFGGELQLSVRAQQYVDLYGTFGFLSSEIKKYDVDPTAVGNNAPYIPEATLNAGVQFHGNLSAGFVRPTLRLDYERRGSQFWDTGNLSKRSAIHLVNLRFGFEKPAAWGVNAWARNLMDEKYNAEFVLGGFAYIAQPRTFGVDFSKRF